MKKTTRNIILGTLAVATLIPGGLFLRHNLERNAEVAEYVKSCDLKAVEVNEALRASIRAQKDFNALAELLLSDPSSAFTIVGQFVAAREAREVAYQAAMDAYFDGGDLSFYRTCDKVQWVLNGKGEPTDVPVERFQDVSAGTERALELYWDNEDAYKAANKLQERINRTF